MKRSQSHPMQSFQREGRVKMEDPSATLHTAAVHHIRVGTVRTALLSPFPQHASCQPQRNVFHGECPTGDISREGPVYYGTSRAQDVIVPTGASQEVPRTVYNNFPPLAHVSLNGVSGPHSSAKSFPGTASKNALRNLLDLHTKYFVSPL